MAFIDRLGIAVLSFLHAMRNIDFEQAMDVFI
jgi:hypothetical protein